MYTFPRAHHDSAADASVIFVPKDAGSDIVVRSGLVADGKGVVVDDAARKARKWDSRMQNSGISWIAQVLIHLNIFW